MLKGQQSWVFENKPVILNAAAVVGPEEGRGPLANDFDRIYGDWKLGQDSWEKSERVLFEEAVNLAVQKAGLQLTDIQFLVGGDLMNQIISSTFAARTLAIPYLGVFGACSTSMESLALAALIVNSGSAKHAVAATASHNATAEKQFRYPTEYGSQKPPTAQYTVTGAGAAVVGPKGSGVRITGATIGKVMDMGLKDPFNMGAAMAPAAVDTIMAHFRDFQRQPGYYDMIVTGDLAQVGYDIALQLFKDNDVPIQQTNYYDCGLLVFDREQQPAVQAGGSGCACSAVVTYGHLLKKLQSGELKRVLVVATGALLSTISFQQGESIPCIAHAVALESQEVN
jgi:stage V sporulation protein AD